MTGPAVSDHAMLRFLERSGLPVEELRASISRSLALAHRAADALGGADHLIVVDGLVFVVRSGVVVTVLPQGSPAAYAHMLAGAAR